MPNKSLSWPWLESTYTRFGCMGDRSVPVTCALEYSSAKSMAHIPVPVPMSRTLCIDISKHILLQLDGVKYTSMSGFIGANNSLPPRARKNFSWLDMS